jgi:hypothetical protein
VAEKERREAAENAAAEALKEATRLEAEAEATSKRAQAASEQLMMIQAPSEPGTAKVHKAQTAYEAQMRATYGTGEGSHFGKGPGLGIAPSKLDFL